VAYLCFKLQQKHTIEYFRTELESLRKALEAENDVAMNAMKNKMIELQKKHVEIVDMLKKKHQAEREEYMRGQAGARGVTPTPVSVSCLSSVVL